MLMLALALAAISPDPDYREAANWLCRPGRQDACTQDLTATVIAAAKARLRKDCDGVMATYKAS